MKLPATVKQAGIIDDTKTVYIEDYALKYLEACKEKGLEAEEKIFLYGEKQSCPDREIYIIYGACGQAEIHNPTGSRMKEENMIGCINMRQLETEHPVSGYYIFYDADEGMKDCLLNCYQKEQKRKQKNRKQQNRNVEAADTAELPKKDFPAELVALSSKDKQEPSPYIFIRAAVICILIIFCAIAVTTINGYGKMDHFIRAAAWAGEWIP